MAGHFHRLKIREVRRETPSTVSVTLDVPETLKDEFHYRAGQYLTFRDVIDGVELRRSYSLCSSPSSGEWRVAVKQVPDGRFSTKVNREWEAGMEVDCMPPMGNFTAPTVVGPQVAFAAGSGITPVMSIIKEILASNDDARFTLFFGNRTYEEIIFRVELEQMQAQYADRFTIHHMLSQEQRGGFGFGRLDTDRLDSMIARGLDIQEVKAFYLCGPSDMIFSIKDHLSGKGISEERIRYELFTAPEQADAPAKASSAAGGLTSTYILDGERFEVEVKNPDQTILDIGLDHGIDLPFACQGGVCCTCRAKVLAGEVDMRQNFSLSDKEVEEGYVLTCQSYPKGGDVTLDYDA